MYARGTLLFVVFKNVGVVAGADSAKIVGLPMKTREVISSVTSSEILVRVSLSAASFFCSCSALPTRACALLGLNDFESFNCRPLLLDLSLLGVSAAPTNATDAKVNIAKT